MAGETLRTGAELLALFPDNTAGLIDAVQSRDLIVSTAVALGFLEDTVPSFSVSVIDGSPVSINALVTPTGGGALLFWALDGNQAFLADYGAIVVPPGLERLVAINTTMVLRKQGGASASYSFQYFEAGVPIGVPETIDLDSTDDESMAVLEELVYDVDVGAPLDLRVTGVGTGDDIDVNDFRQTVTSFQI